MDNSLDLIVLSGSLLVLSLLLRVAKKRKARRRFWVHPYLMDRNQAGRFVAAFEDLTASQRFFTENFHMDAATFETIYQKMKRHLQHKKNTRPNDRIPDKMRLAIVLEYLASGTLCRHMSSIYRISKGSFKNIVDQVCDAILHEFRDEFMTFSKENWLSVANEYNYRWNFPNCLGAIDGKHVAIQCPPNSGSLFYNYKKFYSIVLMAISDASYKFIYVNVGAYGSEGDSGVFAADELGKQIYEDKLPLPEDTTIAGHKIPFTFIADDAFPLTGRIMKPYSPPRGSTLTNEQKIFNYRLSRARRCVENSFGILSNKWLCLSQPLRLHPQRVAKIVSTCCVLHNFLIGKNTYYTPGLADSYNSSGDLVEGSWRSKLQKSTGFQNCCRRENTYAKNVREILKEFLTSPEGSVPWQNNCLN